MSEINFCENNFAQGVEEVKNKVENDFSDANIEVLPCLGYCGDCAVGPFAVVNDEFVDASSPDELYEKIEQQL
jgi:uncharacterized protein YuzB (UPF0349 family)